MKIGILGSSGFIGKQLVKNLIEKFEIVEVSLRQENWNEKLLGINVLINLVGKAHDHKGEATEEEYKYANIELTKQVFEEFLKVKGNLFIHISSIAAIEEYGADTALEESRSSNANSLYGKTKRIAEEWLIQQSDLNVKTIILRPPMIHGEGDKGNLKLLYKLISKGIPYPLKSFNNKRSFLSIGNFVFFIEQIILKQDLIKSGIFHIADDEPLSTNQIIQTIQNVTNKKILNLIVPKFIINAVARVGDFLPLPINTKRLKKMTNNLLVSNAKIKRELKIDSLPNSASQGLEKTIMSFYSKNKII